MAYFMTTPLGRSVPLNDWRGFHADTILKVLYGVASSPFNPDDQPLEAESLCNATGLGIEDVSAICLELQGVGLVDTVGTTGGYAVRLTPAGRTDVARRLSLMQVASGSY